MKKKKLLPLITVASLSTAIGALAPLIASCSNEEKKEGYKIDGINFFDGTAKDNNLGTAKIIRNVKGENLLVSCTPFNDVYNITGANAIVQTKEGDRFTISGWIEKPLTFTFNLEELDSSTYLSIFIEIYGSICGSKNFNINAQKHIYAYENQEMDVGVPLTATMWDKDVTNKTEFRIAPIPIPPDGVSIIGNRIHIDSSVTHKTIEFKIYARYEYQIGEYTRSVDTENMDITLYVGKLEAKYNGIPNFSGIADHGGVSADSLSASFYCTDEPLNVTDKVKWTVLNGPGWLSIDNTVPDSPKLKWSDDCEDGDYKFDIQAEYSPPDDSSINYEFKITDLSLHIDKNPIFSISESATQKMNGNVSFDLTRQEDLRPRTLTEIELLNDEGTTIASIDTMSIAGGSESITLTFGFDGTFAQSQTGLKLSFKYDGYQMPILDNLTINPVSDTFGVVSESVQQDAENNSVTFRLTCSDASGHTLSNIKLTDSYGGTLSSIDGSVTLNDGAVDLTFGFLKPFESNIPNLQLSFMCDSYNAPAVTGLTILAPPLPPPLIYVPYDNSIFQVKNNLKGEN